ncbi:hypothetical protein [Streptomyces sp. NPDC020742]|uniref:hypothetical protein n=1 Tax=Streptomyces sp. NPDC020742 TaxID=3154897 RepID=UPI0033F95F61
MKTPHSRLVPRIAAFLLHGRRPRLDHPDAHRTAGPHPHEGLSDHYRPSAPSPGAGGIR